jgi:hypothetical protein
MFEIPEKQTDGSYVVRLTKAVEIPTEFQWKRGDARPIPDLTAQAAVQSVREALLTKLSQNKSLFKTAPSVASLRAITPVWGMLIRGETVEWSSNDIWTAIPREGDVIIVLRVVGVQISRQSILPIWGGEVRRTLPEAAQIDLDFGGEEDGGSVHSEDMEVEEGTLCLKDPVERKRQMKTYVRDLLHAASDARMKADAALDRFYEEFDLSENESEFSEEDD